MHELERPDAVVIEACEVHLVEPHEPVGVGEQPLDGARLVEELVGDPFGEAALESIVEAVLAGADHAVEVGARSNLVGAGDEADALRAQVAHDDRILRVDGTLTGTSAVPVAVYPCIMREPTAPLEIVLVDGGGSGWGPIAELAQLAARTLGADLVRAPMPASYEGNRLRHRLRAALPRRRGRERDVLVIAPHPGALYTAVTHQRAGVRRLHAWVIDSFWWEWIPRAARSDWYDRIYVSDRQDVDVWAAASPAEIAVLPWGADALAAIEAAGEKDIDLLRVGRQPATWDDDAAVAALAAEHGLVFHGRPAFGASAAESSIALHRAYRRSRAVLAFNNLASPAPYVHASRTYLTGRWVDALAHGALVMGRAPTTPTAQELVPDWARVEIDPSSLESGMPTIASTLSAWRPSTAARIQAHAARALDWRWRLRTVAADLDRRAPLLEEEIARLERHALRLDA